MARESDAEMEQKSLREGRSLVLKAAMARARVSKCGGGRDARDDVQPARDDSERRGRLLLRCVGVQYVCRRWVMVDGRCVGWAKAAAAGKKEKLPPPASRALNATHIKLFQHTCSPIVQAIQYPPATHPSSSSSSPSTIAHRPSTIHHPRRRRPYERRRKSG